MTPAAAIQSFLGSFGIPAYASTSVPHDTAYPYLTYDLVDGQIYDGDVSMTANLWYRTESEREPNAKAAEIRRALGGGFTSLPCDGGSVLICCGSPWCQSLEETGDDKVKRRYLNFTLQFIYF